jgi:23S rRNA (pseudouridine1915-N3)-methyltransferase
MKILLASIGKCKSGPGLAVYEYYTQRFPWKITLKELEVKKPLPSKERKAQEALLLLEAVKDADHIIALDERGKELTSTAFARHLQKHMDQGSRTIAFVIGGADGLHESVISRAHLVLSFGRITWPHLLMRGLLAEQLYRAYTILNHHPYHRE